MVIVTLGLLNNGSLDGKFGPDEGWDVAVQKNGSIVATGSDYIDGLREIALVRYTSEGGPDPSLGGYGYRLVSLATDAFGRGLEIQPNDGKIVIAGYTNTGASETSMVALRLIGDSSMIFAAGFECGNFSEWALSTP